MISFFCNKNFYGAIQGSISGNTHPTWLELRTQKEQKKCVFISIIIRTQGVA